MAAVRKLSLVSGFILTISKPLELVKLNLIRGNYTVHSTACKFTQQTWRRCEISRLNPAN